MKISKDYIPQLITIGLVFIYSLCFLIISFGLSYASPLRFAALRTLIGGISILLVLPLLHTKVLPSRWMWKWIIVLAIPSTLFAYGTMFLSPAKTSVGLATILGNLQPLLTIILASIFLRERIHKKMLLSLALSIMGVVLIALPSLIGLQIAGFIGAAFALLTSLSGALGNIVAKAISKPNAIVTISAWQLLVGSMLLFLASLIFEPNTAISWTMPFLASLLFLGVIGTGLTTTVWYALIQRVSVGRMSLFYFLTPVLGLFISLLILRKPLDATDIVGSFFIVTGTAIAIKS